MEAEWISIGSQETAPDIIAFPLGQLTEAANDESIDVQISRTEHLLAEAYELRRPAELDALVNGRWRLLELVVEARPHILAHFGPDVELVLEPSADPTASEKKAILVDIRVGGEPEEALENLHAFYRDWWFGVMDQADGRLVFIIELT